MIEKNWKLLRLIEKCLENNHYIRFDENGNIIVWDMITGKDIGLAKLTIR